MSKKETIWRHIIYLVFKKGTKRFTQKEISSELKVSTSTVFNALKVPRKSGAIDVRGRFFRVSDVEKFLLIWATERNLLADIIYQTRVDTPARNIEGMMPPDIIFGAFSAYRLSYNEAPADYDSVYIYARDLSEIKKRFPKIKGTPNLFVLKQDSLLASFGATTPDPQTFVDLWNIPAWYAKDYLEALKKKMNL